MNTDSDSPAPSGPDAAPQNPLHTRRKVLKRLLGGLLLPVVVVPLSAVTAEIVRPGVVEDMADDVRNWFKVWHRLPTRDAKKDAVIDDFLNRIEAVIDHDDLADRDFIAETLGVTFVLEQKNPGRSAEEVILDYRLTKPSLPSLQLRDKRRTHGYRAYVARSTGQVSEAYLYLEIEVDGPHSITPSHIRNAFGTPRLPQNRAHPSDSLYYRFRWRGDNFIVALFDFDEESKKLGHITLSQNRKHYMDLKWSSNRRFHVERASS